MGISHTSTTKRGKRKILWGKKETKERDFWAIPFSLFPWNTIQSLTEVTRGFEGTCNIHPRFGRDRFPKRNDIAINLGRVALCKGVFLFVKDALKKWGSVCEK